MDLVFLAGRIFFAMIFIAGGLYGHMQRETVDYARIKGVPSPEVLVPASGLLIGVGGIFIALGLWADLGALMVIAFLVPAAFMVHSFWDVEDPIERNHQMSHFMKNLSMAGAALIIFWIYNQGQDLDLSLTDAFFGRID